MLTGGTALDAPGFDLAPTVVELDRPEGQLATEEVFAPVAALIRAESAEEAISIANAVRYGLVAAVFTSDLGHALQLSLQLDAGMIRVNAPTSGVDFQAPFGGAKESSYGPREQGMAARAFYTELADHADRARPGSSCPPRRRAEPPDRARICGQARPGRRSTRRPGRP